MRPFQQLRLWVSRGPAAERVLTGIAALLVGLMVVWAGLPTGGRGLDALSGDPTAQRSPLPTRDGNAATTTGGKVAAGAPRGPAGAGGSGGSSTGAVGTPGGSGAVAAPGRTSTGPGTPTSGPARPTCATGSTDNGVTATTLLVGVSLPDLGELGRAFNVPPPAEQAKAWNAVFAHYNELGGAQCRRLVPKYYSDNVTDASAEHATCLQMQQDKIFALLNNFYFPAESTCPPQGKIPNFWYLPPHNPTLRKYSPYILSYQPDYDRLVRTYVRGAQQVGWFSGRKKVGILEGSCYPDLNQAIHAELDALGMTASQRSVYNYGCNPSAPSEPEKDTSAVLQFSREGVTHVLSVAYGRSFSFSNVAEGQGYRPKYAVMDDGQVSGSNHGPTPPGEGFDGALAIATSQVGAADTPGLAVSPATAECARIMKANGFPSPLDGPGGAAYGLPCGQVRIFVAAASRAPGLTRRSLATGLSRVGRLDLSFPAGPGNYTDAATPTGGQFWRPLAFSTACNCWKVTSAAFRKGF